MSKIPLISVSGDYYDIGLQIGSALKYKIKKVINLPKRIAGESKQYRFEDFIKNARKYFSCARKYFPDYVKEVRGMADGSNQDFDIIWVLNVEEAFHDIQKCTSIVLREKGNIYLFHNEDFDYAFANNLAVIKANINNKVKFLSLAFPGMLAGSSVSLNSYGLVQGISTLFPRDARIGIPKNFISRAVLEARNIREAINIIKIKHRAFGYNHILIQGRDIINVETTAAKYKTFNINDRIFLHTNNYLYKQFKDNELLVGSERRLENANSIIKKLKKVNIKNINKILRSHLGLYTICRHRGNLSPDVTLSSIMVDTKNLKMHATNGNPCKNKYYEYSLD